MRGGEGHVGDEAVRTCPSEPCPCLVPVVLVLVLMVSSSEVWLKLFAGRARLQIRRFARQQAL